MIPSSMRRRRFLQHTALLAVAAPFVHVLEARAQDVVPRLLLLFHGNGHRRGQWAVRRSDSDFDLGRIGAPLTPFRDHTVLFRGLNHDAMKACTWNRTKHGRGSGIAFTGTPVMSDGWPTGASVDQLLAARIGSRSRLPSIQLGAGIHDTNAYGRTSYAEGGRPIAPLQVPADAYGMLFADALGEGGATTDAARRLLARRRSVLDFVGRDVCALRAELGVEDRRRLEAHCESIREVERSLGATMDAASCEAPAALETARASGASYALVLEQHIALVKLAFGCGLTQIASLQLGQAHGGIVAAGAGASSTHHHGASHYRSHEGGDEAYVRISIWYTEMVAALLGALQSVDRGAHTLLDETFVLWGTDIADGEDHSEENVPWAVFGGRSLGVRGGRMLDVAGRNVNDLLIDACHAMGQPDVSAVGTPSLCRGPLVLG